MSTIKYVCSLGPRCHTAGFFKRNNMKKVSYPFDWIFSNPKMILHCLEDNFNIFLDKRYFEIKDSTSVSQQHNFYKENEDELLFNHHNPLNQKDYNYFTRCIIRFKHLLLKPELKLFVLFFLNYPEIDIEFKQNIIDFNQNLSKYTNNYGILCIIQNTSNKRSYKFSFNENIHFLEISTKSSSNGLEFEDNKDNIFLDELIKSTYIFDLQEIEPVTKEEEEKKKDEKKDEEEKKKDEEEEEEEKEEEVEEVELKELKEDKEDKEVKVEVEELKEVEVKELKEVEEIVRNLIKNIEKNCISI